MSAESTVILISIVVILFLVLVAFILDRRDSKLNIKTIVLNHPYYNKHTDTLYASLDGTGLDFADRIVDTPEGVVLYFNECDDIKGLEIFDFEERYGNDYPIMVHVKRCDLDIIVKSKIEPRSSVMDNFNEVNIEDVKRSIDKNLLPDKVFRPIEPGYCAAKGPEITITDESRKKCAEAILR